MDWRNYVFCFFLCLVVRHIVFIQYPRCHAQCTYALLTAHQDTHAHEAQGSYSSRPYPSRPIKSKSRCTYFTKFFCLGCVFPYVGRFGFFLVLLFFLSHSRVSVACFLRSLLDSLFSCDRCALLFVCLWQVSQTKELARFHTPEVLRLHQELLRARESRNIAARQAWTKLVSQVTDRHNDRKIDRSTDRPTNGPTDQPTNQPTVKLTGRPADQPMDRLASPGTSGCILIYAVTDRLAR